MPHPDPQIENMRMVAATKLQGVGKTRADFQRERTSAAAQTHAAQIAAQANGDADAEVARIRAIHQIGVAAHKPMQALRLALASTVDVKAAAAIVRNLQVDASAPDGACKLVSPSQAGTAASIDARVRIHSIVNHAEAKTRPAIALSLALMTRIDPLDAAIALASLPIAKDPRAASQAFRERMEKDSDERFGPASSDADLKRASRAAEGWKGAVASANRFIGATR
jgi:hypothetical protein